MKFNHYGPDIGYLNYQRWDVNEFELLIPDESKHVVTISKLSPRKRIDDLLRAWSTVEEHHPDATLTIAGSGPLEEDLHSLRDQLDLENVTFEGFVSEPRKLALLRQSAVFAAPTLYEGFGLSVLEAMASGCAVITSKTWGLKDFVEDGVNGVMIPPKSPQEFADKLCWLLKDSDSRKRIAQTGRETAEEYSMAASLDREHDYLQAIYNGRSLGSLS